MNNDPVYIWLRILMPFVVGFGMAYAMLSVAALVW